MSFLEFIFVAKAKQDYATDLLERKPYLFAIKKET